MMNTFSDSIFSDDLQKLHQPPTEAIYSIPHQVTEEDEEEGAKEEQETQKRLP